MQIPSLAIDRWSDHFPWRGSARAMREINSLFVL
jgi:hypothetical protein